MNLARKRKQNPNINSNSDQDSVPPQDSRPELDALHTILQNHTFDPLVNNFSNYQIPDPTDSSRTCYSLPAYLSIYVQTLLGKMNDHAPPDALTRTLAPFIFFDLNSDQYIVHSNGLNGVLATFQDQTPG
jgi:hypothetical protein